MLLLFCIKWINNCTTCSILDGYCCMCRGNVAFWVPCHLCTHSPRLFIEQRSPRQSLDYLTQFQSEQRLNQAYTHKQSALQEVLVFCTCITILPKYCASNKHTLTHTQQQLHCLVSLTNTRTSTTSLSSILNKYTHTRTHSHSAFPEVLNTQHFTVYSVSLNTHPHQSSTEVLFAQLSCRLQCFLGAHVSECFRHRALQNLEGRVAH